MPNRRRLNGEPGPRGAAGDFGRPDAGIAYEIVARAGGGYYVKLTPPSGRSVIVGEFETEQDAHAWIGMAGIQEDEPN